MDSKPNDDALLPRTPRPRKPRHDYRLPGPYFVTVCTAAQKELLAFVEDGEMHLTAIGRIVEDVWRSLPESFPGLELDTFVVMPNHCHGLLWLPPDGSAHLESVIRRFKSEVTRLVREQNLCGKEPVWQRSFFEHVVRRSEKLSQVREYIRTNPERWIRR